MNWLEIGMGALLLCLLGYNAALALSIDSSVDKSQITVGDWITYTLTIRYGEDEQIIRAPEILDQLGLFEVRDVRKIPGKKDKKGMVEDKVEYVITAYQTGQYEIPPVSVIFVTASGDTSEIRSEQINIEVESVLPDLGVDSEDLQEEDIQDIKPPVKIEQVGLGWLLWIGVAVLAISLMRVYLWRKHRLEEWRRRKPGEEKPIDELAEFDKIAAMKLLEKGEYKMFHILLSDALRRYMERRWGIDAMERTTYEIAELMGDADIDEKSIAMTHSYLEECDLVKFAKYVPPMEVMERMVERGKDIVRATQRFVGLPTEDTGPTLPVKGQAGEEAIAQATELGKGASV